MSVNQHTCAQLNSESNQRIITDLAKHNKQHCKRLLIHAVSKRLWPQVLAEGGGDGRQGGKFVVAMETIVFSPPLVIGAAGMTAYLLFPS